MAISIAWNHTILDFHGFRQTQTAITTDALLHGSNWFAYNTPVMGAPWSIPFEFPLYQWCVAVAVLIFHTPLDQTGRFVSAAFFYATVLPLYGLLRNLGIREAHRWLILSLYVTNPFYLFWARTFMIESTALFLSVAFLDSFFVYVRAGSSRRRYLALVFGALAAAVKITTFFGFVAAAALVMYAGWREVQRAGTESGRRFLLRTTSLVAIPCIYGFAWTRFADWERSQNPLAKTLSSGAVALWGSGGLRDKLSPAVWFDIFSKIAHDYWGAVAVVVALVLVAASLTGLRSKLCLALLVLFAVDVLAFTNLFALHDYYFNANGIFLIGAAGVAIAGIIEKGRNWTVAGYAVFALVALAQLQTTFSYWVPLAISAPTLGASGQTHYLSPIYEAIDLYTKPDDVLIIYGQDWVPVLPYYARRRALMDPRWVEPTDPRMDEALANLSGSPLGAMIFCGKARKTPVSSALTEAYGFAAMPVYEDQTCSMHLRTKRKS